jgi:hypothetical protein
MAPWARVAKLYDRAVFLTASANIARNAGLESSDTLAGFTATGRTSAARGSDGRFNLRQITLLLTPNSFAIAPIVRPLARSSFNLA